MSFRKEHESTNTNLILKFFILFGKEERVFCTPLLCVYMPLMNAKENASLKNPEQEQI